MQKLIAYAENQENRVHSLAVLDMNGNTVYMPWAPHQDVRHPVYSITKSILSIGLSFLVRQGKLDIHKPLASCFTQEQLALVPAERRAGFGKLPVTRFLTMSLAGYPFRPEGDADWLEQALSAEIDYEQPPTFSYSNFPALLVGVAAQNAADQPFMEYLNKTFLSPSGIPGAACKLTPEGYFYGASGMELSARELIVLGGYLYHATRTDPYLQLAVSTRIPTEQGGYGYFFRVGDGYYCMSGKWGQKCIVFPETGVILSYLSDRKEGDSELFRLALDAVRNV